LVEIRVIVEDSVNVPGLMWRLAALFGSSAISFDQSCNEVRVDAEWESRAVVSVTDAVQAWIDEAGVQGANLWIGEHSYRIEAARPLPAAR